jgi:hypothetical protein
VAAASSWGCASASSPPAAHVSFAIESANADCRLDREEHLSLGRFKLSLLKPLVRLAGEHEAAAIVADIDRVEVASYRVRSSGTCNSDAWASVFWDDMAREGWWPMVVERDDDGSSWVFARGDEGSDLEGLYVVAMGVQELEVVRIEGRLDRMMARAMADEPFAADGFFTSDR